jgi:leucyl/phenylalanyl-tRNA--protein transferase
VDRCADRHETWINGTLHRLYLQLHAQGHAHSVEAWQEGALVGGAFGIAIGGAFFGESMFSTRTDASKVATAYLVDRLRQGGFVLLDTQFLTPHLASLGGIEISRARYRSELAVAIAVAADFNRQGAVPDGYSLLQRSIQTS